MSRRAMTRVSHETDRFRSSLSYNFHWETFIPRAAFLGGANNYEYPRLDSRQLSPSYTNKRRVSDREIIRNASIPSGQSVATNPEVPPFGDLTPRVPSSLRILHE